MICILDTVTTLRRLVFLSLDRLRRHFAPAPILEAQMGNDL